MSSISVHVRADGIAVVNAPIELDKDSAPDLRNMFIALVAAPGTPRIVVDLGAVDLADSVGLGVLVGGLKRAKAAGGTLVIADVSERIRKTFRVTGLLKHFTVHETANAAVEALTASAPEAA